MFKLWTKTKSMNDFFLMCEIFAAFEVIPELQISINNACKSPLIHMYWDFVQQAIKSWLIIPLNQHKSSLDVELDDQPPGSTRVFNKTIESN